MVLYEMWTVQNGTQKHFEIEPQGIDVPRV